MMGIKGFEVPHGDVTGLLDSSASTKRGQVFVNTRYFMLSKAASNISSVNSLGTILFVLAVLDAVFVDPKLAGRSRTSSHGQITFSLPDGDEGPEPESRGKYGSYSTSAKIR